MNRELERCYLACENNKKSQDEIDSYISNTVKIAKNRKYKTPPYLQKIGEIDNLTPTSSLKLLHGNDALPYSWPPEDWPGHARGTKKSRKNKRKTKNKRKAKTTRKRKTTHKRKRKHNKAKK